MCTLSGKWCFEAVPIYYNERKILRPMENNDISTAFLINCWLLWLYFAYCIVLCIASHLMNEELVKPEKPLGGALGQNVRWRFLEEQLPLHCSGVYMLVWPLEVSFEWLPDCCRSYLETESSMYFCHTFVFWLGNIVACFVLRKVKYICVSEHSSYR